MNAGVEMARGAVVICRKRAGLIRRMATIPGPHQGQAADWLALTLHPAVEAESPTDAELQSFWDSFLEIVGRYGLTSPELDKVN
jgi:hypothetical protein